MCEICQGMSIQESLRRDDEQIARSGWMVTHVESEDPAGRLSYSMGLTAVRHPELVMLGSAPRLAQFVLGTAASQVVGGHRRFEVGEPWVLAGERYRVANGRPRAHLLLGARRRYGKGITVLEFIADTPWWGRARGAG
ncbi:DUF4262 domain-containing protein [Arthrobacter sp. JSM 101049]|uniref:DUF4262 domain-containing protein n=1 Tax=Arthrobacter sp. JSM 101049 TaxID=929097 RepID=UPI003569768C